MSTRVATQTNPAMAVRWWHASDEAVIRPMIRQCLAANADTGFDVPARDEVVDRWWTMGVAWAAVKDPTLVLTDEGVIIGYTMWGGQPDADAFLRRRLCYGFGTYIEPTYRRAGWGAYLRREALTIARERGYAAVVGTAYSEVGLRSSLHDGFKVTGWQVEYTL